MTSVSERAKLFGSTVNVKKGGTTPTTTPTEPERTSAYDGREGDQKDAEADLRKTVKDGGFDLDGVVQKLYYTTVKQMQVLSADTDFMKAVADGLADASEVLKFCMAIHATPKVMFERYTLKGGADPGQTRSILAIATPAEVFEICQSDKGPELKNIFAGMHIENALGEDFRRFLVQRKSIVDADSSVAWMREWWGDKSVTKVDTNKTWVDISKTKGDLQGALVGNPSAWDGLIASSPQGNALSATGREALDKIVLNWGSDLTAERIRSAFLVRWGSELTFSLSSLSGQGYKWTSGPQSGKALRFFEVEHHVEMWKTLKQLPSTHVTADTVRSFLIDQNYSSSNPGYGYGGGHYTDHIGGSGTGASVIGGVHTLTDNVNDPAAGWKHFGDTIRHEVGHAVDTKRGGFENFSSKSKAKWTRFYRGSEGAFGKHFAEKAAGGLKEVADAVEKYLKGGDLAVMHNDIDAIDAGKWTGTTADDVKEALEKVSGGGSATTADGGKNINGYKFRQTWSSEYQSYKTEGEDTTNISNYAYNSWAEFFAECYMLWFKPKDPSGYCEDKASHGTGTLPNWVRAAGFDKIVATEDPAKVKGVKKN